MDFLDVVLLVGFVVMFGMYWTANGQLKEHLKKTSETGIPANIGCESYFVVYADEYWQMRASLGHLYRLLGRTLGSVPHHLTIAERVRQLVWINNIAKQTENPQPTVEHWQRRRSDRRFDVKVGTLQASNGTSYVVMVDRDDRPAANPVGSSMGRMEVFSSENCDHATLERDVWDAFLNEPEPIDMAMFRASDPRFVS